MSTLSIIEERADKTQDKSSLTRSSKLRPNRAFSKILRGGRITKHKGQAASYAPSIGLVIGAAILSANLFTPIGPAFAGTCTESMPGNGVWTCSGAANVASDSNENLVGSGVIGDLFVTTDPGFGLTPPNPASGLALSGTNITFTDSNASNISAYGGALFASTTGDLTVTSNGTITTTGYIAPSILAVADGTINLTVNDVNGTGVTMLVFSRGDSAGDINITTTGTITATSGAAISVAEYAANSATDINIDVQGDITGGGAIYVINDLVGDVNITTGAGDITGTGFSAITAATGRSGGTSMQEMNITTGDGAVTGALNGIFAEHAGTALNITTGAGGVSGNTNGISADMRGTGDVTISVAGAITGGTGSGVMVTAPAGQMATINLSSGAAVSATSGMAITEGAADTTVALNTGASVTGEVRLGDGSDEFVFAGGDFSGITSLDGGDDTDEADSFIDTLRFQDTTGTFDPAFTSNWERVNIDAGSNMTFQGDTLTIGTLTTENGGILDATNGFTLIGNLVNNGVVNMRNGAAGGNVTVNGNYQGTGRLQVDVDFATDTADTLTINGDVISGSTMVEIADVSSGTATGNDINVVEVSGTTQAGDFSAPTTTVGAYLYDLNLVGNAWVLQSTLVPVDPPPLPRVVPTVESFAPALTIIQDMGRDYIGTLWERVGRRDTGSALWGRIGGKLLDAGSGATSTGASFETSHGFMQAGIDFAGLSLEEGDIVLSLIGHYGASDTNVDNAIGAKISDVDIDGYGVGGSVTFYNPDHSFYVDAVGQTTWYDASIVSTQFGNQGSERRATGETNGFGYALSLETGYRYAISEDWAFVPQAQIIYAKADFDSFTDSEGVRMDVRKSESLQGRIGFALEGHMNDVSSGYFRASLIEEFKGKNRIVAAGTNFEADTKGTSVELSAGGSFAVRPGIRLYTDVTGRAGVYNEVSSLRGTAGVDVNW